MKDMDKIIYKEIENYQYLNKNNRDMINQIYINKNKSSSEFLEFLYQLEKSENIMYDDNRKNRFK